MLGSKLGKNGFESAFVFSGLFSVSARAHSLGFAITFPHFSHFDTCNGSYMETKNFDFGLWTI
jgi:hypothetical protein